LSVISWREQVTFCQLYHSENKLHFVSYIMERTSYILSVYHGENKLHFVRYIIARTSYILSAISWREQVTFCQPYHGENKLHFDEMMSTLYSTNSLSWIVIVLAHWHSRQRIDMSFHSDISWFRANQSFFIYLFDFWAYLMRVIPGTHRVH
jgi:hypothetical protein